MAKLHLWLVLALLVIFLSVGVPSSTKAQVNFTATVHGQVGMQHPDGSWEGIPGVTIMVGVATYLTPQLTDENGYYEKEISLMTGHPEMVHLIPCSEMREGLPCPRESISPYIFDPPFYSSYYAGGEPFSELEVSFTARPIYKTRLPLVQKNHFRPNTRAPF